MVNKYQLVIDQGTSGTKLLILENGKIIFRKDKAHKQIYPKPGWVEHDPIEIINNVKSLLDCAIVECRSRGSEISSISITNQRETIVAWNKTTGEPLYNAIVWQCNRGSKLCDELIEQGKERSVVEKSGLKLDPYFSGSKIKWLFENIPEVNVLSNREELAIGTMDSWIVWNLTKRKNFVTEASNASRTLIYNIVNECWDKDLANLFDVRLSDLPTIINGDACFGYYEEIPIIGVLADSQSALLGENCTQYGDVKVTMGTGCSVMMQVENKEIIRDSRILYTMAWQLKNETKFALEGIIRSCGDSINWYKEQFMKNSESDKIYQLDLLSLSGEQVFFIPALQGLAAPYWNNEITASFIGMKRSTVQEDCMKAVLESTIFQVKSVIDIMEEVSGQNISKIFVDGGLSKNRELMQLLATLLNKNVIVGQIEEYSALGAVSLAKESKLESDSSQITIKSERRLKKIRTRYIEWKKMLDKILTIQ